MMKALGMIGAGQQNGARPVQQTIVVVLNGAPLLKYISNNLPSMLRLKGLPV